MSLHALPPCLTDTRTGQWTARQTCSAARGLTRLFQHLQRSHTRITNSFTASACSDTLPDTAAMYLRSAESGRYITPGLSRQNSCLYRATPLRISVFEDQRSKTLYFARKFAKRCMPTLHTPLIHQHLFLLVFSTNFSPLQLTMLITRYCNKIPNYF